MKKGPTNSGMGNPSPPLFRAMPESNLTFFLQMSSLIWRFSNPCAMAGCQPVVGVKKAGKSWVSILNRRGVCGWAVGFAAIFGGGHLPMGQNFTLTHSPHSQYSLNSICSQTSKSIQSPQGSLTGTSAKQCTMSFLSLEIWNKNFGGWKLFLTIPFVIFQDRRTIFTPQQCFVIFLLIIDVIAMGRAVLEGG